MFQLTHIYLELQKQTKNPKPINFELEPIFNEPRKSGGDFDKSFFSSMCGPGWNQSSPAMNGLLRGQWWFIASQRQNRSWSKEEKLESKINSSFRFERVWVMWPNSPFFSIIERVLFEAGFESVTLNWNDTYFTCFLVHCTLHGCKFIFCST